MNLTIRDRLSHYRIILRWYYTVLKGLRHPTVALYDIVVRDFTAFVAYAKAYYNRNAEAAKATAVSTAQTAKDASVATAKLAHKGWVYLMLPLIVASFALLCLSLLIAGGTPAVRRFLQQL